ncbi:hypothetical protein, partial [Macrococcus brunensis]|uniref:hypothetical protein n=1 Tax=Macrococcus brunensis TaxID=198483 RepID=UPI00140CE4D0
SYLNEGGYVLNFTNDSFRRFIVESIDIDPYIEYGNMSKGKLLTAVYENIENHKLITLTQNFVEEIQLLKASTEDKLEDVFFEYEEIDLNRKIKEYERKLKVLNDILNKYSNTISLNLNIEVMTYTNIYDLKRTVEDCFKDEQYLNGLDRLHTLFHSYLIEVCKKNHIDYHKAGNEKERYSMDSLYNKVINNFISNKLIVSEVTGIILQSNKQVMRVFNEARNNHSRSHPTEQWIVENEARYINSVVIATIHLLDYLIENTETKNSSI